MGNQPEEAVRLKLQRLIRDQLFTYIWHPIDEPPTHGRGGNVYTPPTEKVDPAAGALKVGKIDILCLPVSKPSWIVEVKRTHKRETMCQYLTPSQISEGQRNVLDYWTFAKNGDCYLAIGTMNEFSTESWDGKTHKPSLYVIPWRDWVRFEVKELKNINARVGVDVIETLFGEHALLTDPNDGREFVLPMFHVLRKHMDREALNPWGNLKNVVSLRVR